MDAKGDVISYLTSCLARRVGVEAPICSLWFSAILKNAVAAERDEVWGWKFVW